MVWDRGGCFQKAWIYVDKYYSEYISSVGAVQNCRVDFLKKVVLLSSTNPGQQYTSLTCWDSNFSGAFPVKLRGVCNCYFGLHLWGFRRLSFWGSGERFFFRGAFGSMQKTNGHRNELRKKTKLATSIVVSIRTGFSTMENQSIMYCNDGKYIIPIISTPENPGNDFLHCSQMPTKVPYAPLQQLTKP